MSPIVFEHVPVEELPEQWRLQLHSATVSGKHVTVRIESEDNMQSDQKSTNPMFGLWRERSDVVDVERYVRGARAPRYPVDASPAAQTE